MESQLHLKVSKNETPEICLLYVKNKTFFLSSLALNRIKGSFEKMKFHTYIVKREQLI